jgi:hypothetical protein
MRFSGGGVRGKPNSGHFSLREASNGGAFSSVGGSSAASVAPHCCLDAHIHVWIGYDGPCRRVALKEILLFCMIDFRWNFPCLCPGPTSVTEGASRLGRRLRGVAGAG